MVLKTVMDQSHPIFSEDTEALQIMTKLNCAIGYDLVVAPK